MHTLAAVLVFGHISHFITCFTFLLLKKEELSSYGFKRHSQLPLLVRSFGNVFKDESAMLWLLFQSLRLKTHAALNLFYRQRQ